MTEKYHINSDGEPKKCTARKRACPFGTVDEHYKSEKSARIAYETKMNQQLVPTSANRSKPLENWDELNSIPDDSYFLSNTDDYRALDKIVDKLIKSRNMFSNSYYESYIAYVQRDNYEIEVQELFDDLKTLGQQNNMNRETIEGKLLRLQNSQPPELDKDKIVIARDYHNIRRKLDSHTRAIVNNKSILDKSLRKLAKSNQPNNAYFKPYEAIYDHPNVSQKTKNIVLEKSEKTRRMERLDALAQKYGNLVEYISISKKSDPNGSETGRMSKTILNYEKLDKLDLDSEDVNILINRGWGENSYGVYDELSGSFTREIYPTDNQ